MEFKDGPMKTTTLRFRFARLVVVLLSFAALSSTMSLEGQIITRSGHEIDYFSDATHTHQVGVVIFCRNGQTFRSGQVTQFSTIGPSGC